MEPTSSNPFLVSPHANPFTEPAESEPESEPPFPMPHYRIRRMRPEDIPEVLEIWALNGLHEGTETIRSFMSVDPGGFIVAVEVTSEVEEEEEVGSEERGLAEEKEEEEVVLAGPSKEPSKGGNGTTGSTLGSLFGKKTQICCCAVQAPNSPPPPPLEMKSMVASGSRCSGLTFRRSEKQILGMCAGVFVHPSIAFIGLYAVRPHLHGRGIGMSIWRRLMEHVSGRNAGLYAVIDHLSMYRDRAGFRHPDERMLMIFESGGVGGEEEEEAELKTDLLVETIRGIEVVPVEGEQLFEAVGRYDAEVHGYSRVKLLEAVLKEEGSVSLVALDIEEEDETSGAAYTVQGYGCIRTNNIGKAMLGPLYADNDAVAELLMRRLFTGLSGPFSRGLLYMTLDSNPGGEGIANKLGLRKAEELPRFFLGEPYKGAAWSKVYAIHSPNFSLL